MLQLGVIGTGNWGTTIAKLIAENRKNHQLSKENVLLWVFEENIDGTNLSVHINENHMNPKYLPGIPLPHNLIGCTDLQKVSAESDILFFALPHEFLANVLQKMVGHVKPSAKAISLMKGVIIDKGKGLILLSDMITKYLKIPCGVVMGANRAGEVAGKIYGESTVGCADLEYGKVIKTLLQTSYLRLVVTRDQVGVEMLGALKNIVALAAGIIEGLGHGDNTKAAFIRLGYCEILSFLEQFYVDRNVDRKTVFQSCGFAEIFVCLAHNKELMSTPIDRCYGSRNILAGIYLAKTDLSLEEIETQVLKGASAQGAHAVSEVMEMLIAKGQQGNYPVFKTINDICKRKLPAVSLIRIAEDHPVHR